MYVYIHGFRSIKNAVCKLGDWYVDQKLTLLRYALKQIDLVSLFFPLVWISQKMFTWF